MKYSRATLIGTEYLRLVKSDSYLLYSLYFYYKHCQLSNPTLIFILSFFLDNKSLVIAEKLYS